MSSKLEDTEFGSIALRRIRFSRNVRLRIDQRGKISISMPSLAPLFFAKRLLESSRDDIRRSLQKINTGKAILKNGDLIGKTHRLQVAYGSRLDSNIIGTTLKVTITSGSDPLSEQNQAFIRDSALKALRTQSKAYLTRKLQQLANNYAFSYKKIRFTNAGTRWGSCSSSGTISLNIWLMQLPFKLIDYVLIHELCHTKQMNHSPRFWALVEQILPDFKERRRALKAQRPYA